MKLKELATKPNLKLAWKRITTGANLQYKQSYRDLYSVYEVALDANLRDLRQRIIGGTFKPHPPERIYLPKPSGLHRPITLLHIEDQIVLQAFANLAAKKVHRHCAPLQFKVIFSSILQKPDSIFFFRKWQETYSAFQQRIRKQYEAGMEWVGDFDLAAFYDTISHELLLKELYPRTTTSEGCSWIKECLQEWSSDHPPSGHGHGLPQGPLASDFLAECFLLPIDQALQQRPGYVRYVDDVRVLGATEEEVRAGVIELERLCQRRGLIPQADKLGIRRCQNVQEALGMLPSIADPQHEIGTETISKGQARKLFLSALGGKPYRVKDKARLRYVLYRAGPDRRILELVLLLIPRHPEFAYDFFLYLGHFDFRKPIEHLCLDLVENYPSSYVRGQAWHVLARYRQHNRSKVFGNPPALLKSVTKKATEIAKERNQRAQEGFMERWGACHFLCVSEDLSGSRNTRFLKSQSSLLQSFLAPVLPDTAFEKGGAVEVYLKQSTPEPGLSVCPAIHKRGLPLATYGVKKDSLPSQVAHTLRALGVLPGPGSRVDSIAEILKARYQTPTGKPWRKLLGKEYNHALGILKQAEASFDSKDSWLMCQNSFNQAIFLRLQEHLKVLGHPAACCTTNRNGELINFGITLEAGAPFSKNCPGIGDPFWEVNERRNRLPEAHPYQKKTVTRSQHLGLQERDDLLTKLRAAYAAFAGLLPA